MQQNPGATSTRQLPFRDATTTTIRQLPTPRHMQDDDVARTKHHRNKLFPVRVVFSLQISANQKRGETSAYHSRVQPGSDVGSGKPSNRLQCFCLRACMCMWRSGHNLQRVPALPFAVRAGIISWRRMWCLMGSSGGDTVRRGLLCSCDITYTCSWRIVLNLYISMYGFNADKATRRTHLYSSFHRFAKLPRLTLCDHIRMAGCEPAAVSAPKRYDGEKRWKPQPKNKIK